MNGRIATLAALILTVFTFGCTAVALAADDPGPRLQYGGTPIDCTSTPGSRTSPESRWTTARNA